MVRCAAVDLGAGSGRVIVGERRGDRLVVEEVHRFASPMVTDAQTGGLTWDIEAIEREIRIGLAVADRAGPIDSVGIDGWGVDYVLIDAAGERLGPVHAYRDHRTDGMMDRVFARMPRAEIYRRTGIQFLPFNTLYQLAAGVARDPDLHRRAARLLMIPDHLIFRLSGVMVNEYTNATTTQCYGLDGDDWDAEILAAAGFDRVPMARPVEAGTVVGSMAAPAGGERRVAVIAVASHDTASAVAGTPLASADEAFVSSGTWSLIGFESPRPFATEAALELNVANEGGFGRRYRVLKNLAGMWPVQRMRAEAGDPDWNGLIAAATAAEPWRSLIDLDAERFLTPVSMTDAVRGFCAETGQPVPGDLGGLARAVFDSLALDYAEALDALACLRGRGFERLHVVGGGSRNRLVDQSAADACGIPVVAGPVETSALGNVVVQMIALGALTDLDEARALVARSFPLETFVPSRSVPAEARARFRALRTGALRPVPA